MIRSIQYVFTAFLKERGREMVDFAPGMRTIIRDEEWMVKKVETNSLGNKSLYCTGVSPLVKDRDAIFLADLEQIQVVNPAEVKLVADDSAFYKKSLLYLESRWRQKIPTDYDLHIGHKAAMDLMPFQLDPAKIALRRPRQRILIADTVGLGKTLEAGILMSELIVRGKGKRILVVTAKSMMTQFQKEMWNRFTIPLVRLDSRRIQKIRSELPSNYNPFFYYDKTIVSVDTLKRDVEYRTHLENAYWDIIVIDEAQNVAERGDHKAQRARLAKLLADRSDTMIMLSATPHDGRAKSFASLMNMLDPTAIADPGNYTPEDISGLFVRRFKKDVKDELGGAFLERNVTLERCRASAEEERAFEIFADMQLEMDLGKSGRTEQLFKTSLEKSLFSSPAACIKSIEERLKKLRKKYADGEIEDIKSLSELETALLDIKPENFSRYQTLLSLLRDKKYGWNPDDTADRIVIFTERIETMKYIAEHLRRDLAVNPDAIQEISGSMSDAEQQQIVENFGREASPIRILVASDVASEGLNLHYLSHRLIHFDIPWSLMVFQQRNGRIDRYGQNKRPDIRYMLIESDNKRIKGDMRIMEILIQKEEQALKNIGDPALLLGKFSIQDEELVVMDAIEKGSDADAFEKTLDNSEKEFDPFEAFMKAVEEADKNPGNDAKTVSDDTLFSDKDYLYQALEWLNRTERNPVEKLDTVSGLDIRLTDDMRRRLSALVPEEAMPQGDTLRLSDDKTFCMHEMRNSMRKNMDESAWPKVQYLWKLHPILSWINDKAGLFFKRDEAPVIGLPGKLKDGEMIFIVSGSMPNRKSTLLIDEWFGLLYRDGTYVETLPMTEVVKRSGIRSFQIPNTRCVTGKALMSAESLREDVVKKARSHMDTCYRRYINEMNPKLDTALDKLAASQSRHKSYLQETLFDKKRQLDEKERRVDEMFDRFANWVRDTLEIQNNPYIRIETVLMGAKQ
jgi:superfamily II DNA/RNA helicase